MKACDKITKARRTRRKALLFLLALSAVGASFGAYQYIISGTPVDDPSAAVFTEPVSLDARIAGDAAMGAPMETRSRTSATGICQTEVSLSGPGLSVILR